MRSHLIKTVVDRWMVYTLREDVKQMEVIQIRATPNGTCKEMRSSKMHENRQVA